jgi:hypothetical protein
MLHADPPPADGGVARFINELALRVIRQTRLRIHDYATCKGRHRRV